MCTLDFGKSVCKVLDFSYPYWQSEAVRGIIPGTNILGSRQTVSRGGWGGIPTNYWPKYLLYITSLKNSLQHVFRKVLTQMLCSNILVHVADSVERHHA